MESHNCCLVGSFDIGNVFFFFFFLMKLAQNIRIINIIILTSINAVVEKYSFLTVGEICYKTREIFNPETIPIIPEKCASPAF